MKKLKVLPNSKQAPASVPAKKTSAAPHREPTYWRSLDDKRLTHDEKADNWKEFPDGAEELELKGDGVSRRRFFGLVGSGAALAGVTLGTEGCIRKPVENIMPYSDRPEDLIPGKPMYYASAFSWGGSVEGVVVKSQDGRPIKVEGNPKHAGSQGAASVFAQASVLDLYDPDRSRHARKAGEIVADWKTAKAGVDEIVKKLGQGEGVALVTKHLTSPLQKAQVGAFKKRYPQARIFECDHAAPSNAIAAAEMIAGDGARYRYVVDGVKVIFSADADFLAREQDTIRLTREWSWGRKIVGPTDRMSRLYVVEPHLTNTGTMADHRSRVRGSQVGDVLIALANELHGGSYPNVKMPQGGSIDGLPSVQLPEDTMRLVKAAAQDLAEAIAPEGAEEEETPDAGSEGKRPRYKPLLRSAVLVGHRQPAWVHALGAFINASLGNTGRSQRWRMDTLATKAESLTDLAAALPGQIKTVICFDCNPAYDAPAELGMADKLQGAVLLHAGTYYDETAAISDWHLPLAHYLESWGDEEASDGTITICQPLIEPLHDVYAPVEMLGYFATSKMEFDDLLIQRYWKAQLGPNFSEKNWRRWLHDGLVSGAPREPVVPNVIFDKLGDAVKQGRESVTGTEIDFHLCPVLLDGRYANNAWLQELPRPLTKITWDNAAYMAPSKAAELGVVNGDLVAVSVDGRSLELPVFIAPGQADDTVSITLGGNRKLTRHDGTPGGVCEGAGFDAAAIRPGSGAWFASGSVAPKGGAFIIANTQDYGSMKPPTLIELDLNGDGTNYFDYDERPIVIEATVDEFNQDPNFVERANLMPQSRLKNLFDSPPLTGKQQWGMSVDLNTCTGCLSCVIACQAENNIPVVGKERVVDGREMHWMRIDRYYRGDDNNPTAVFQPMLCQQCETAPCETVCPVAATTHSPEGLNDMAYNRCIGTRYCMNNCPYKVRRFNFLDYTGQVPETRRMQYNPNVSVRMRGVMEKCSYCVQRIQEAKISARRDGRRLRDGDIKVACQQACPSAGIFFGDLNDPNSRVSKLTKLDRQYKVLPEVGTQPRTSYLAKIRNPNPEMQG
jgi:MoCo/4Fe-4S cofactor protein with predicted Tat translocation signal